MSIILLRGFSQSGKDFVGKVLCDKYNYKRYAFAESLKKMVAQKFNCLFEQLETQKGKQMICTMDVKKRTYRQILIDEAQMLRGMDEDVFAKYCCKEISEHMGERIVVTDWRYENEYNIIKQYFPTHIIIPVNVQRYDQTKSPVNDISEYQLIDRTTDYQLVNRMDATIMDEIDKLISVI